MVSLAYLLIYLINGHLPWGRYLKKGPGEPTDDTLEWLILSKTINTSDKLCRGLPVVFHDFLEYVCNLETSDTIDYPRYVQAFRDFAL